MNDHLTLENIIKVKHDIEKKCGPMKNAAVVCSFATRYYLESQAIYPAQRPMLDTFVGMRVFFILDMPDDESLVFDTVEAAIDFVNTYEGVRRHAPETAKAFVSAMLEKARRA